MINSMAKRKRTKPVRERRPPTRVTLALYAAGSSPSEIARQCGVSHSLVTRVCNGQSTSARVVAVIEKVTGKSWDKLRAA
jgi:DNA invertase Pin-like site-specific DNA recombinase